MIWGFFHFVGVEKKRLFLLLLFAFLYTFLTFFQEWMGGWMGEKPGQGKAMPCNTSVMMMVTYTPFDTKMSLFALCVFRLMGMAAVALFRFSARLSKQANQMSLVTSCH